MALPSAGAVSLSQAATELGGQQNLAYYRGRGYYRNGAFVTVPGGAVGIADLYGLSASAGTTAFTISGFSPASPISKLKIGVGSLTQAVTVSTLNGVGPFTYSWSIVSDDAGGSITSGGSTVTATYQTMSVSPNATRQTVLRCTATDTGDGSRQQTADCTINWEWEAI
jgi:hypothetical protein